MFAKTDSVIADVIKYLRKVGAQLENDVNLAGFLVVDIERNKDGSMLMTQTSLIDRTLLAMNLGNGNAKITPASERSLPKDAEGEPCNETFSYPNFLGILLYLQ